MTEWISVKDKLPPSRELVLLKTGFFSVEKVMRDGHIPMWYYPSGVMFEIVKPNDRWRKIDD